MPSEIYSKSGSDVANVVKRQFGDPDGRQITDSDILEWINQAQQEIVSQNPLLKQVAQANIVDGQDVYQYPASRVQYIEAIHYRGIPLEAYSFQEAQTYILRIKEPETVVAGRPEIWYERDGSIYLFPFPDEDIPNGLRLFFTAQPDEITSLSDTLSVPDRYYQRVIELVLARAYQLDENWEAARYKQAEFMNGMEMLANQEHVVNTNTYPSITTRIEDL
jgi:hypothetical protein